MTTRTRLTLTPAPTILVASLVGGCTSKVSWTEAKVDEELSQIEDNVPFCHVIEAGADVSAKAFPRANGTCGGAISGTSEHDNGVTDYEILLEGYCLTTDDGDLVLDGVLRAREVGKPSDDGPIIDRLEGSTDGPVIIDHGGEITEFELQDGLVEYGLPEAWAPGVPTEDDPDLLSVKEFALTFPDGSTTFVTDVEASRTGDMTLELTVTAGEFGVRGDYTSDLRTPEGEPLVFDLAYLNFGGSGAELQGKRGSVLTIIPEPLVPGRFDLELDGEPYKSSLDCSEGVVPVMTIGAALYTELPIY